MSTAIIDRRTTENTLSDKQLAFIGAYLGDAKFNATEAARQAGYSVAHQSGWDCMQNEVVKQAIRQRLAATAMHADELLMMVGHEARGIGEYIEVGEGGDVKVNVRRLKRDGKGSLITGLKSNKYGQTIEFVDPLAAQTLLAKVYRMISDGPTDAEALAVAEASKLKAMAELVRLGVAIGQAQGSAALAPVAVSGTTDVVIESSASSEVPAESTPGDLVSRVPLHDASAGRVTAESAPGALTIAAQAPAALPGTTEPAVAALGLCMICGELPADKVTRGGGHVCSSCIPG